MEGKLHTPLARAQDGLLTRRQLLALGWGEKAVEHAVRQGWLHRVHNGVYSLTPVLTRRARWRAAHLATGAAISHVSAAAMHGLLPDRRIDVEVTTTRAIRSRQGIVVRRCRSLRAADLMQLAGIPVTTPTPPSWTSSRPSSSTWPWRPR